MNKREFLETLRSVRTQWEELLVEVGKEHMQEPGVEGSWSVKDIIAHVTWPEREMVAILQARSLAVGSELWDLPQDELNDVVVAQKRDRPLQEVLAEEQQAYARFFEALNVLSEEELVEASHYQEMPADWIPWEMFASNCFEHYRAHMPALRPWLEKQST